MRKIIAFLRRINIKNRIALFLLTGLLLFSIAILVFSTYFSQKVVKGYLYEYVSSVQKQIATSFELMIDEVTMLTVRLQVNNELYALFDEKDLSYEARSEKLKLILDGLLISEETVGNIVIVTNEGEVYSYNAKNKVYRVVDPAYTDSIDTYSVPIWGDMLKDDDGKFYSPFGVKLRNFYTGQKLGYMIVYIREEALLNIYKEIIPEWGYSFIATDEGYVVSHPQKEIIGKVLFNFDNLKNGKNFTYKTTDSGEGRNIIATHRFSDRMRAQGCYWNIVSVITYDRLFEIVRNVNILLVVIGIGMLLISILVSVSISKKLNTPIKRLGEKLNEFGRGKLEVLIAENEGDEIWELEKSFDDMVVRIRELILNNNMEKEKQRQLELVALQAQINPHFLYNTLDAIGWIAKLKKQTDIEQMVIALARFFRLSLHKGDKFITLEEEIQLVQSFVTIEQMRAPEKFDISYNIPEDLNSIKILKIIIQPLVENAIKHGISRKRGKGRIEVNACRTDYGLRLEVIDDGAGFDMSSIDFWEPESTLRRSGYGLRNVDERIKLEYGKEYGLKIMSELNRGTKAVLTVRQLEFDNDI